MILGLGPERRAQANDQDQRDRASDENGFELDSSLAGHGRAPWNALLIAENYTALLSHFTPQVLVTAWPFMAGFGHQRHGGRYVGFTPANRQSHVIVASYLAPALHDIFVRLQGRRD